LAQVMGVRGHPAAGPRGLAVVVIATAGGEPVGMITKAPVPTDVVTINRYKQNHTLTEFCTEFCAA
jgi:hypothetical protein